MPPWLVELVRFLSAGAGSGWFGLACPAHCSFSITFAGVIFLAGFACGALGLGLVLCYFFWPLIWTSKSAENRPAPPSRLAAYLHERPNHSGSIRFRSD